MSRESSLHAQTTGLKQAREASSREASGRGESQQKPKLQRAIPAFREVFVGHPDMPGIDKRRKRTKGGGEGGLNSELPSKRLTPHRTHSLRAHEKRKGNPPRGPLKGEAKQKEEKNRCMRGEMPNRSPFEGIVQAEKRQCGGGCGGDRDDEGEGRANNLYARGSLQKPKGEAGSFMRSEGKKKKREKEKK